MYRSHVFALRFDLSSPTGVGAGDGSGVGVGVGDGGGGVGDGGGGVGQSRKAREIAGKRSHSVPERGFGTSRAAAVENVATSMATVNTAKKIRAVVNVFFIPNVVNHERLHPTPDLGKNKARESLTALPSLATV